MPFVADTVTLVSTTLPRFGAIRILAFSPTRQAQKHGWEKAKENFDSKSSIGHPRGPLVLRDPLVRGAEIYYLWTLAKVSSFLSIPQR
jgi:hypothetical protein